MIAETLAAILSAHATVVLGDASRAGTVDAWTVVHRAPRAGVAVPYTIARIRLAEGARSC